jgi:hypothetical protein
MDDNKKKIFIYNFIILVYSGRVLSPSFMLFSEAIISSHRSDFASTRFVHIHTIHINFTISK